MAFWKKIVIRDLAAGQRGFFTIEALFLCVWIVLSAVGVLMLYRAADAELQASEQMEAIFLAQDEIARLENEGLSVVGTRDMTQNRTTFHVTSRWESVDERREAVIKVSWDARGNNHEIELRRELVTHEKGT
jgi:hypothetical protein